MITPIPYDRGTYFYSTDTLIVSKRGGGERRIPAGKWWIDRNTPVGEDADLWERMPNGGRRHIPWNKLIAVEHPPL